MSKTNSDTKKLVITAISSIVVTLAIVFGALFATGVIGAGVATGFPEKTGTNVQLSSAEKNAIPDTSIVKTAGLVGEDGVTYLTKKGYVKAPAKDSKVLSVTTDPACGYCYEFENTAMKEAKEWMEEDEKNVLAVRMIPMLDRSKSPNVIDFTIIYNYLVSQDPEHAFAVYENYWKNWADGQAPKFWDVDAYKKILSESGVRDDIAKKALFATNSKDWVALADKTLEKTIQEPGFLGTPHVLYNGKKIEDLYFFIEGAMSSFLKEGKVIDDFSIQKLQEKAQKAEAENKENSK